MATQRRGYNARLPLPLREKCDLVDLPATYRMRNDQINISVSCWIIYSRVEVPVRLEKLRVKLDLALDVNLSNRRSELGNLCKKLLLRRRRKIHPRMRTQTRCEEVRITLNSDALDGVLANCFPSLAISCLLETSH